MFQRAILPLLLLAGLAQAEAPAVAAVDVALAPNEQQAKTAAWVSKLLSASRFHYNPAPLDDALSSQIFDSYLEALDADRSFFLQGDIDRFAGLRTSLDDALRDRLEHDVERVVVAQRKTQPTTRNSTASISTTAPRTRTRCRTCRC